MSRRLAKFVVFFATFSVVTAALPGPPAKAQGKDDPLGPLLEQAGLALPYKIYRQPAPDFELTDLDGKTRTLAKDFKGQVVVLYMFAEW